MAAMRFFIAAANSPRSTLPSLLASYSANAVFILSSPATSSWDRLPSLLVSMRCMIPLTMVSAIPPPPLAPPGAATPPAGLGRGSLDIATSFERSSSSLISGMSILSRWFRGSSTTLSLALTPSLTVTNLSLVAPILISRVDHFPPSLSSTK